MYHIWWNEICAVKWDMKVNSDNMDNNYDMLLKWNKYCKGNVYSKYIMLGKLQYAYI